MPKKKRKVITEGARRSGRGSERVYAYTFSSYQRSHGRYPIKVGMTRAGSAEHRITQQIGASNAETPILLLEISCDNAAQLERSLHRRLKSRHIPDVPGKEWFRTTPEEIASHMRSLDPRHVETLSQGMMVLIGWLLRGAWMSISKTWQLLCWTVEASTRSGRSERRRKRRRMLERAEETLARFAILVMVCAIVGTCALAS